MLVISKVDRSISFGDSNGDARLQGFFLTSEEQDIRNRRTYHGRHRQSGCSRS
jgi:hypothetical protein